MTLKPRQLAKSTLFAALFGLMGVVAACNGGLRPTLAEVPTPTPLPRLELELPAAPVATPPLDAADLAQPLESSVDDALTAWAASRNIAYLDSCSLVTPEVGQLCDVQTERDTVRLLGPSKSEIWYVVTVLQTDSFEFGTGFRVASVDLAGAY